MATANLEQARISDVLEWYGKQQLELNPNFQRRSVWTPAAKVYLVDTILRQLSIPKFYMRTKIDLKSRHSIREVVDGQQRLRAIIEFAGDHLLLTRRAHGFEGLRYSTLGEEYQTVFLSYPLSIEQLINASDSDVLEVFARLNSYNLTLNAAETRHAKYQGPFKWAVHQSSQDWHALWEHVQVVSVRNRLRMADDSTMAELYGVVLEGVQDGRETNITKLYDRWDFDNKDAEITAAREKVNLVLDYMVSRYGERLAGTPIAGRPQFLMLFAAVAHCLVGLSKVSGMRLPANRPLLEAELVLGRLEQLAAALDSGDVSEPEYGQFILASRGATASISSRRIRFAVFYEAITGIRLEISA